MNNYETSDYGGDREFNIDCTGDAVVGDEVRFERATFSGYYRNAKFAGFEQITGKIIHDSYGAQKQQHTFTLLQDGGKKLRIKGRNLYANGLWRKKWADEEKRSEARQEKHTRGKAARAERDFRIKEEANNFVHCARPANDQQ